MTDLPARMVEAAAEAMYGHEVAGDGHGRGWAAVSPETREAYREPVRPMLAAGLRVLHDPDAPYGMWPIDLAALADEIEGDNRA